MSFSDLPLELRLNIWELAVFAGKPRNIVLVNLSTCSYKHTIRSQATALLGICHEARAVALKHTYYVGNIASGQVNITLVNLPHDVLHFEDPLFMANVARRFRLPQDVLLRTTNKLPGFPSLAPMTSAVLRKAQLRVCVHNRSPSDYPFGFILLFSIFKGLRQVHFGEEFFKRSTDRARGCQIYSGMPEQMV